MRRMLLACLFCALGVPSIVFAQSTIDKLQPVPTFPLPDPAGVPSNLWITQGGGDYKISPYKLGSPYQGPTAPVNPFLHQLWWDTASVPAQLVSWNGTNWIPFSSGFLNVTGFGVVGDGTDVSAALQAVVNNTALQGCLYFPPASPGYALGSAVTLPDGTCLVGDPGRSSRMYELPTNTQGLLLAAPSVSVQISNLLLDGNRGAGAAGNCFATDPVIGVNKLSIENVAVLNCASAGIYLGGSAAPSQNVQISNSAINHNFNGITAQYLKAFNITGNRIHDNDSFGIRCGDLGVGYCQQGAISGGNILATNGCIVLADNINGQLEAVADVTVSNNVSISSCGEGIQMGGTRTTISGNHLIGNQQNGIFVQSVRRYTTGTISVNNGSTAVTGIGTGWAGLCPDIQRGFISNTGTRLQTSVPPGNAVTGGGSTPGVQIKSIDSNTAMTLSDPWTGSTLLNATYTIRCPVPVVSPVIAANTIQGVPSGWNGIYVDRPQGGTITGNSVDDTGGLHGILVSGDSSGITVSANTVSNKTNAGIRVDSTSRYSTGTVTTTSGSPTVTMTGGTFDEIPGVTWFRATGDAPAYQVNAQTATTLTLASNYTGSTASGKTYIAQSDMSMGTNASGNVSRLNDIGVNVTGCWGCAVAGGSNNNNTTASVVESGASSHNILTGFSGAIVTVIDPSTQWFSTGNGTSLHLGNLPVTPGSKQPVCVDPATSILYRGSAGTC